MPTWKGATYAAPESLALRLSQSPRPARAKARDLQVHESHLAAGAGRVHGTCGTWSRVFADLREVPPPAPSLPDHSPGNRRARRSVPEDVERVSPQGQNLRARSRSSASRTSCAGRTSQRDHGGCRCGFGAQFSPLAGSRSGSRAARCSARKASRVARRCRVGRRRTWLSKTP